MIEPRANIAFLNQWRDSHLLALMYRRTKKNEHICDTVWVTIQGNATLLKVHIPHKSKLKKKHQYSKVGKCRMHSQPKQDRHVYTLLEFKHAIIMHQSAWPLTRTYSKTHVLSLPSLRIILLTSG